MDNKILVGLSGGADSVALLHYLVNSENKQNIIPVHINYGVHHSSNLWEEYCRAICENFGLELKVHHYTKTDEPNFENSARKFRYDIFSSYTPEKIVVGHHLNDQLETTLFRILKRGTGVFSAMGMREHTTYNGVNVWRPFINWTKKDVLGYCRTHKLDWVEDTSNYDVEFDRNWIRHCLSGLDDKFPNWHKSLISFYESVERKEKVFNHFMEDFLKSNKKHINDKDQMVFDKDHLNQKASEEMLGEIFYHIFHKNRINVSKGSINSLVKWVRGSTKDPAIMKLKGLTFEIKGGKLYCPNILEK